jgi:hypothetical protein
LRRIPRLFLTLGGENPCRLKKIQGEGDDEASRRYRERTGEFLEENNVDPELPVDASEADQAASERASERARDGQSDNKDA